MTTSPLSAQQRLAASRQALLRDMKRESLEPGSAAFEEASADIAESGIDASAGSWDLIRQVARSWWQSHPAHLAVEVAKPMMQNYAQEKPFHVLGVAAATGAAIVVLRPWRLISLTGVALTLLKSTEVSGIVQALLHGGRGQDRQP
jgi:hypothetical protein